MAGVHLGTGEKQMSDDTMSIAATLAGGWYDRMRDDFDAEWLIDGKTYRLADDEQYKELGEDPRAADLPVILFCETDGKFFKVDFEAYVHETSAESRRSNQGSN
jgi:hypothetical protein